MGRLTALLPSYEAVQHELAERGVALNIKEVHGIGRYAGQAALTYRCRELEQYRAGALPAADGAGKRFGAMIDGGRVKIRTTTRKQKGRGKGKKQKRRFRTDWREPKQIIVFEMDDAGRMKKGTKPILDGTFGGPDEMMELLAMRLHQVGAASAQVVAFRRGRGAVDLGASGVGASAGGVEAEPGVIRFGLVSCGASCQSGVGGAGDGRGADADFQEVAEVAQAGGVAEGGRRPARRLKERDLDETARGVDGD